MNGMFYKPVYIKYKNKVQNTYLTINFKKYFIKI